MSSTIDLALLALLQIGNIAMRAADRRARGDLPDDEVALAYDEVNAAMEMDRDRLAEEIARRKATMPQTARTAD